MADAKLTVTSIDDPVKVFQSKGCKQAVTREAKRIASRANTMSAGFRTGLWYPDNDRTQEPIGGDKPPKYEGLSARPSKDGCISLVVEKNYAAIKDNHQNNTLRKALG